MGWKLDLGIHRSAIVGDIDPAGEEFVSPWGRLVKRSDGSYAPTGAAPTVSLHRVNDGWEALTGSGTRFTFAATDAVAGGYSWMLSRIDGILGDSTVVSYTRNPSGRPFISTIEWGGRGSEHQYCLVFDYETIATPLEDYRAGLLLTLDRRIRAVRVLVRSAEGTFDIGWTYQLDYTASPRGAAFYLTGVTKRNRADVAEPTQHYSYDFGDTTLANAVLTSVPALRPVLPATDIGDQRATRSRPNDRRRDRAQGVSFHHERRDQYDPHAGVQPPGRTRARSSAAWRMGVERDDAPGRPRSRSSSGRDPGLLEGLPGPPEHHGRDRLSLRRPACPRLQRGYHARVHLDSGLEWRWSGRPRHAFFVVGVRLVRARPVPDCSNRAFVHVLVGLVYYRPGSRAAPAHVRGCHSRRLDGRHDDTRTVDRAVYQLRHPAPGGHRSRARVDDLGFRRAGRRGHFRPRQRGGDVRPGHPSQGDRSGHAGDRSHGP